MNTIQTPAVPWRYKRPPGKILVMRFQALGDIVITLPYLQDLKNKFPNTALHLLTRKEDRGIPRSIHLFDKVIVVKGGRNAKLQFVYTLLLMPYLWIQGYDLVLDLQNHKISRFVRKALGASAWCAFDKISPVLAGERTRLAIEAVQLTTISIQTQFRFRTSGEEVNALLRSAGWDGVSKIVALNPAGTFSSRNWQLDNYIVFARQWLMKDPVQFLTLGLQPLQAKTAFLKQHLGDNLIDLAGKTLPEEAFRIIGKVSFMLTEDGGLMHMAWVQGIPTLALFGSSRSDWSSPCGPWSHVLDSSDLPCGNCMDEICRFGDVHCLSRYSPDLVYRQARTLLAKLNPA